MCMAVSGIGLTDVGYQATYYQKIKVCGINAKMNGYCDSLSGYETFITKNYNWENIVEKDRTSQNTASYTDVTESNEKSYRKVIQEKIEELLKSLQSPEHEPSFQIGGATFTEEEWKKLLEKVDKIEETIRRGMEEAIEDVFTAETTQNTVLQTESKKEEIKYLTWYTNEGIFCRKQGQTEGFEWSVNFTEDEQYNKVLDFLHQFDAKENLTFASQENFWRDYLSGKIDEERFKDLYASVVA